MSIQEPRRAAFEKWYAAQAAHNYLHLERVDEEYIYRSRFNQGQIGEYTGAQKAWLDWNAALDSVCVVLPEPHMSVSYANPVVMFEYEVVAAIEAAGIRCEVSHG